MERVKALTTEAVEKQFPDVMDALKDRYGIRRVKRCACGAVIIVLITGDWIYAPAAVANM